MEHEKHDIFSKEDIIRGESSIEPHVKMKKSTMWKGVSAVLAILLIASIATGGFGFKGLSFPSSSSGLSAIVISDKRCAECDTTQLITQLKTVFPTVEVKEYDYSDKDGKAIYEKAALTALPAILFSDAVKTDANYAQVQNYLEQKGDYLSLRIGAEFDPGSEICDNKIDDTGDGKIDCADPTCEGSLLCRAEKKKNLQVFIMSDCPYGRKAVEALKEVADNFKTDINYEVHYIANEAADGFSSLHGQYEVDEDIIQLCVKAKSPAQWLDYIYCRSTKGVKGIDWKECAASAKVDAEKVKACFEGTEGKNLLKEDIKIANALNIGASPTWLANNRVTFSGIDAETVKTSYCRSNTDLAGCKTTLTGAAAGAAPAAGCVV